MGAADAAAAAAAPPSEAASREARPPAPPGPARRPGPERAPMEAPGLAKAAAADADARESSGETPDGAPAHFPGPGAPSPEPPAYRPQDFDTLATVGECDARGPGPLGRSAPPGKPASDKRLVCGRPAAARGGPCLVPPALDLRAGLPVRPGSAERPETWRASFRPPRASPPADALPRTSKVSCFRPSRPPPSNLPGVWAPPTSQNLLGSRHIEVGGGGRGDPCRPHLGQDPPLPRVRMLPPGLESVSGTGRSGVPWRFRGAGRRLG